MIQNTGNRILTALGLEYYFLVNILVQIPNGIRSNPLQKMPVNSNGILLKVCDTQDVFGDGFFRCCLSVIASSDTRLWSSLLTFSDQPTCRLFFNYSILLKYIIGWLLNSSNRSEEWPLTRPLHSLSSTTERGQRQCCVFGYAGLSDMTCYSIKSFLYN